MKTNLDLRELAVNRDNNKPAIGPKRHILSRYVIPVALLLGFAGIIAWATRDVYLPRRQVTVMPVFASRAVVRQEGTPLFNAAGWVEPRPIPIRVSTLSSGVVRELLVVEDQLMTKGQPVALLVDDDAKLALEKAKANLELRKADVTKFEAEKIAAETNLQFPLHLEAAVAEAKAAWAKLSTAIDRLPFAIDQANSDLKFAQQDLEGKKSSGQVVAGIELDRAVAKLTAMKAKVADLRKQKELLGAERDALRDRHKAMAERLKLKTDEIKAVGEAKAKLDAAKARLQEAKVAVAEAQLRLDRMTVIAPVSGRVLRLMAAPGTHLAAGMGHTERSDPSTVVTMYQPDKLQVRVDVRFDDLLQVFPGQPVRIESPALPKPMMGKTLFISSLADIQKNTLEVKVGIDAPKLLKPEMLVDATFLAPKQKQKDAAPSLEQRLFVPKQLVASDDKGKFVWIADSYAGTASKQPIEVGRPTSTGLIEVVKGLTLSSRLIVNGRDGLHDGARISIAGEDTTFGVSEQP